MKKILLFFKNKRNLAITGIVVVVLAAVLTLLQWKFKIFADVLGAQITNTATLYYDENGQTKSINSNTATTSVVNPSPSPQTSPSIASPSPSPGGDKIAPIATVTSPTTGTIVRGSSTKINITATDNVGVVRIQIYLDGVLVKNSTTTSTLSYSWNTRKTASGVHTIYAKAYDAAGNVGTSATITVTK